MLKEIISWTVLKSLIRNQLFCALNKFALVINERLYNCTVQPSAVSDLFKDNLIDFQFTVTDFFDKRSITDKIHFLTVF